MSSAVQASESSALTQIEKDANLTGRAMDKKINFIFKTLKKMIIEEDKSKRKIGFEE